MSDTNEKNREEDSGLHDIRNLAAASKSRISARRSTQSPVVTEDDVLASSSAGWKGIALPEPAKMISLPELASLPSAVAIEKADKASRAEAKAAAKAAKRESSAVIATATDSAVSAPMIGSRVAAKQSSGKGGLYAGVGVLLAAAAGVGIYMYTQKGGTAPAAAVQQVAKVETTPAPVLKEVKAPIVAPIVEEPKVEAPAVVAPVDEKVDEKKAVAPAKAEKVHKVEIRDTIHTDEVKPAAKVEKKDEPKEKGDGSEPSFDALLKEGGISDTKQAAKPTLEKKSLTTGDFKTGMAAVSGRAQGCYAGTQGTANVKLTIASDGSVSKASVTGPFAGTPVAACVEGAVKAAKFPAWDGGPQSFSYAYLLAE
ncbi:MAG TPA: hypothetical protein VGM90_20515 [Kofleriaceae bacterium]